MPYLREDPPVREIFHKGMVFFHLLPGRRQVLLIRPVQVGEQSFDPDPRQLRNLLHQVRVLLRRRHADAVHTCIEGDVDRRSDSQTHGCIAHAEGLLHREDRRPDLLFHQRAVVLPRVGSQDQDGLRDAVKPEVQRLLAGCHAEKGGEAVDGPRRGHCPMSVGVCLDDACHLCLLRDPVPHGLHIEFHRVEIYRRPHSGIRIFHGNCLSYFTASRRKQR